MKSKLVTAIAAVLAILFAAAGGYLFCVQPNIEAELYTTIPVYLVSLILGVFVENIIHEGAHFLVGAICRMGVKVPKIRLFRSSSVEMCPKGVKGMKGRLLATVLAGITFDLMLIVLGIIAFVVPSVPVIVGFAAPYALYSFIINAVPLEYGEGKTDGLVALEVIKKEPTAQVMLNILKIQGYMRSGVFLKDIDEGLLLDVPQLPEDDINFIILTQLRYEYYLAKGDDSEAYKYFMRYQQLIDYLPSGYKNGKK
ncbi:MAG: hypothetical protein ACI4MN_00375 [Candidatus Coproplasma sp.]